MIVILAKRYISGVLHLLLLLLLCSLIQQLSIVREIVDVLLRR